MLCHLIKILGLIDQKVPKYTINYFNINKLNKIYQAPSVDAINPIFNLFPGVGHLYRQKSDS